MPEVIAMSCEQQKQYAFRGRGLAGFTLVELVVVMVLISLFMVFSIPLFSNIGTSSLGTSARRLSGTIKYLFNESAMSGLITTRIHPSGWVEETIIHLDDGAGEMLTLRVSPLTGTTEVFDGYREF